MYSFNGIATALFVIGAAAQVSGATYNYSFTGVGSDGRTLSFQYTAQAPIAASTVLTAAQVSCAPACDDAGIFPNAQLKYDLVVFDVRNAGSPPTPYSFYFPYGAFSNPGNYASITQAGAQNMGSLTVTASGLPAITSPVQLANAAVGIGYSTTLIASGGAPPYTFTVDPATPLPAGLSLSTAGALAGIPAAGGNYTFTVKVTDGAAAFSNRTYTMSAATGVAITTPGLPNGSLGAAYSQGLSAAGGTLPYSWTVATGSLPPGLTLSPAGLISGVPSTGGSYNFTARVNDAASGTASQSYVINIASVLTITTPSPLTHGAVGAPYSVILGVLGGTAPYTWTVSSGTLPVGLALSPAGTLAGTPASSTNSIFAVRVTDAIGTTANQSYTLYIGSGLTITTNSPLPSGMVGTPHTANLGATGGTGPYTWVLTGGALPPGLTMSATGLISGTPSTATPSLFSVRVNDSASGATVTTLSLTIMAAITVTTPATLPAATPGIAYSQTFTASGGSAPYTWTLATGSLPPGLALSTLGVLSGTPVTGGTSTFVLRVNDNTAGTTMQAFTLVVGSALAITTPAQLPNAAVGVQYALTLAASGGTPPYLWTLAAGAVPPGLTLASSGLISGTPASPGSFTMVVRVTDNLALSTTQSFNLTVGSGLAIATAPALPNGVPGVAYSQTLTAVGGTPPYAWTVTGGSLPPGLTMSPTGVLGGTPGLAGAYTFLVQVADAAAATATQSFSLSIGSSLTITTTSPLINGVLGAVYSQTFAAAGGTAPYVWTLAGGSVPPGLSLATNGTLTGTPSAQGSYIFLVRVTDGAAASVTQPFTLTINTGLAITTTSPLPAASVGAAYSLVLQATGGVAPYTWSQASGILAPGLVLANNGAITGTPTAAGAYNFGVRVLDAGLTSATMNFTLTVGSGISITTTALASGAVGVTYSQTLTATGGTAPYVWSLFAGTLPPGLALANNGALAGTPISTGSYGFTVRVTDAATASATQTFTLVVNPAITIVTTSPLPVGTFGVFYFQTLSATGGVAPYTWNVATGAPPPGVTMATNGVLSGTPGAGGVYTFVARATDSVGTSATQSFTLTVNAGINITTTSPLPDATAGSNYFLTFGGSGGVGPYTWAVFSGNVPPGLALSAAGALTGVPATAGAYSFVVRLTDNAGVSTTAPFSITVTAGTTYPRAGVISQLASGGGWKTTISLSNLNAAIAQVRVNLVGEDGLPLILPMTVTQGGSAITVTASTVDRTLGANATLLIETEAAVSVTTVGWADVRSSVPVTGYAIFRQRQGSGAESEGTSVLENRIQTSVIVPYDNLAGFSTGVAVVNLGADAQGLITAIMRDDTGAEVGRDLIQLPPNGHTSFSMHARFPVLSGRRGFVEFQSNQPGGMTALGLRFNPAMSFTNVPVAFRPQ
ncbi:MAG: putative Ig domain-containing protein [Candidatus Solibacter usitatus]|nr:putative Ig domain-containing protein [Candidatus Solibacter usitatus]